MFLLFRFDQMHCWWEYVKSTNVVKSLTCSLSGALCSPSGVARPNFKPSLESNNILSIRLFAKTSSIFVAIAVFLEYRRLKGCNQKALTVVSSGLFLCGFSTRWRNTPNLANVIKLAISTRSWGWDYEPRTSSGVLLVICPCFIPSSIFLYTSYL